MFKSLKSFLATAGWITIGATAIGVEKVAKGINHISDELESGMPQDLVRYHCNNAYSKYKSIKCSEPLHNHHDGCPACDMPV